MAVPTATKACTKCGETKVLEDFPRKARAKDGRDWMCRSCIRQYHLDNRDRDLARSAAWAKANAEHCRELSASWKRENHERHLAYNKAWGLANPDRRQASHRNAKAKRRALETGCDSEAVLVTELTALMAEPCAYCGTSATHADHIRPLSKGGTHTKSNLVAACATCNLSKHSKLLNEWDPVRVQHAIERSPKVAAELARITETIGAMA